MAASASRKRKTEERSELRASCLICGGGSRAIVITRPRTSLRQSRRRPNRPREPYQSEKSLRNFTFPERSHFPRRVHKKSPAKCGLSSICPACSAFRTGGRLDCSRASCPCLIAIRSEERRVG